MSTKMAIGWGAVAVYAVGVLALICTARGEKLEFDLVDVQGRRVQSQDYEGRPLFLEFGACW